MKKMKRIIPVILACMLAFGACGKTNPTDSSNSGNGGDSSSSSPIGGDSSTGGNGSDVTDGWKDNENVIINNGASDTTAQKPQTEDEAHYQTKNRLHNVNVSETNKPFVVNGKSEYKILIPEKASTKLQTAATYFKKYIKNATGCNLEIEDESSYTWSEDAKWIVFGRTDLFNDAGLTLPNELSASGYYIKSVGNSVFVAVRDDYGYHRAALSLLKHIVGYEMYWSDTVIFDKDGSTLPEFDITENPDFEYYVKGDKMSGDGEYGMGFDSTIFISPKGYTQHNTFIYLPKEEYQADHPGWYSVSDGAEGATQLCYTARGNEEEFNALVTKMALKVISYIDANPDMNNITITQEDRRTTCGCEACKANYTKYKSYAASIIMFMNAVDDQIQNYLQAKADAAGTEKRIFNICFFAYHKSEVPPVVKNADGSYSPVDENVICNEHVGVYIAPIDANYQHSFYEEENNAAAENIKGWGVCASIIYMWVYETNYAYYLYPINTWDSQIEMYRFLKENNAIYIFNEAQYNQGAVTHFSRLKEYINSKAYFDVNVDLTDVMDDFFTNYYGPAAEPMRAFFDQLQAHMRYLEEAYPGSVTGNIYNNMEQTNLWPKKTLDGFLALVDQAYELIEEAKDENPDMYEVYKEHVLLESIFPRFAKLRLYKGTFTSEEFTAEAKQFKSDCTKFNITMLKEQSTLDSVWTEWGV